jgi:hypothetical protein
VKKFNIKKIDMRKAALAAGGLITFVLLTWVAILLYSGFGFDPDRICSFQYLINFLTHVNIFAGIGSIILASVSIGIILSVARILDRVGAFLLGWLGSIAGVLPVVVLTPGHLLFLHAGIAFFYIVGITAMCVVSSGYGLRGLLSGPSFGWNKAKHIFYILAIGVFIMTYVYAASHHEAYKSSFIGSIAQFAGTSTSTITRDQIRVMVGTYVPDRGTFESYFDEFLPLDRELIEGQLKLLMPDFEERSELEQQLLVDATYLQYAAKREAVIDDLYESYTSEETLVEIANNMYEQMNSKETRGKVEEATRKLMGDMPLTRTMMELLPLQIAFLIVSFLLMIEFVMVSPIAAVTTGVLTGIQTKLLPELELRREKKRE